MNNESGPMKKKFAIRDTVINSRVFIDATDVYNVLAFAPDDELRDFIQQIINKERKEHAV